MAERVPAYEGAEPYVFVSYAHKNSQKVLEVINELYDNKYRVWYDEGIAPGSEWPKNIETHLRGASAVLVCVSKESLASPNCENEVVNSNPTNRRVIQLSIDGSRHELLKDCVVARSAQDVITQLDESFLGDGETGYHTDIGTTGGKNRWTSLIVLAACLILALGTGIYGLNAGWFDNYLPGLQKEEKVEQVPEEEIVDVDNIITQAAAEQTDENLVKQIEFKNEETRSMLYDMIGYNNWDTDEELTYFKLTTLNNEECSLNNANDEILDLMKYFKNMKTVHINGGKIDSLEPLTHCPKLETVFVSYEVLPVEIPRNKQFDVLFER